MEQLIEFATNHWELVLALVVVSGLLLGSGSLAGGGDQLGPGAATALINHEDAVVVDTRELNEFNAGHVIDSIHIPAGQVAKDLHRLEKYKQRPIIIACRSGSRSASARRQMRKQGFEKVYNLQGGIMAWQNANLPLVRGK